MSKVKENAALSAVQLAATGSSAFNQIDTFVHTYDRGAISRSMANRRILSIKPLTTSSATTLHGWIVTATAPSISPIRS